MDRCVLLTSTPSCVVSPRDDHSDCTLVITRRGKTTYSGVDVNITYLSMINPLSKMHGSTQKCPVRHKMPGLTQKCPPQHASVDIAINIPRPPSCEKFFFQFYSNILSLRTHREMKRKFCWYEFKNIQYHYEIWNVIILFCLWWP